MPDRAVNAATSKAYSVHWPRQRWRHAAGLRQPPAVVSGAPHHAEPSFRRAAVQPGSLLDPIGVCDQAGRYPPHASSRSSRPATTRQCTKGVLPSEVPPGEQIPQYRSPKPQPCPQAPVLSSDHEPGGKLQRRLRLLSVTDFSAVAVLG